VNKACASGLQAVVRCAEHPARRQRGARGRHGAHDESVPFLALDVRWGKKLGDETLVYSMYRDGYLCPLCNQLMGETSETLATEYKIPREEQDQYALASHQRAARAWDEGRFAAEVVAIEVGSGKRATKVERDENPRADASLAEMETQACVQPDGSVTAGNASRRRARGAAR
jgi:acetyl-CoA C-acetyltransferase